MKLRSGAWIETGLEDSVETCSGRAKFDLLSRKLFPPTTPYFPLTTDFTKFSNFRYMLQLNAVANFFRPFNTAPVETDRVPTKGEKV